MNLEREIERQQNVVMFYKNRHERVVEFMRSLSEINKRAAQEYRQDGSTIGAMLAANCRSIYLTIDEFMERLDK